MKDMLVKDEEYCQKVLVMVGVENLDQIGQSHVVDLDQVVGQGQDPEADQSLEVDQDQGVDLDPDLEVENQVLEVDRGQGQSQEVDRGQNLEADQGLDLEVDQDLGQGQRVSHLHVQEVDHLLVVQVVDLQLVLGVVRQGQEVCHQLDQEVDHQQGVVVCAVLDIPQGRIVTKKVSLDKIINSVFMYIVI